jgi:hypothetical protein
MACLADNAPFEAQRDIPQRRPGISVDLHWLVSSGRLKPAHCMDLHSLASEHDDATVEDAGATARALADACRAALGFDGVFIPHQEVSQRG